MYLKSYAQTTCLQFSKDTLHSMGIPFVGPPASDIYIFFMKIGPKRAELLGFKLRSTDPSEIFSLMI